MRPLLYASALVLIASVVAGCGGSPSNGSTDGGTGSNGSDGGQIIPDGPPAGSSGITITVFPNGNHESEVIAAINAATQSVYMTMYEIDDSGVLNALVAKKTAGLDVQAIIDGSSTTKSFNTSGYNTLHNAGIDVVWSSSAFTYTHEKTIMIDQQTAWIMTANMNTSVPSANREYLAKDTDAADVAEAVKIFKADHAMTSVTPTGNLVVANTNARPDLVQLINSATTTLDVEVEEFSDTYSTGVVNAVAAAAQRGVTTHVIIANDSPVTPPITTVKNAGAKVVITGPASGAGTMTNPYIHAKAIVVDCSGTTCARAFIGSENFSGGSLGYNRELGVIFTNQTEIAKVETAIQTDFSKGVAQ